MPVCVNFLLGIPQGNWGTSKPKIDVNPFRIWIFKKFVAIGPLGPLRPRFAWDDSFISFHFISFHEIQAEKKRIRDETHLIFSAPDLKRNA